MGYRSTVLLAVAFGTKEQLEEVWAVYCLNPKVQAFDLAKHWEKKLDGQYHTLWYYTEDVKWYDSYEAVMAFEAVVAFEAIFALAETFRKERETDFNYAWVKLRIGEEYDDNERRANHSDDELIEYLYEAATINRYIEHSF